LQMARLSQEYDMPLQVHAPYHNVRLADINPRIREASVQSVKDGIDFATRLNARMVTVHLGNVAKVLLDRFYTRVHEALLDSIKTLIDCAEAGNLFIGIENVPSTKSPWEEAIGDKAEELVDIIKEVKAKNVGVTFDVGHANTTGDPAEFAAKVAPYVMNIHVHDNDGRVDQHLIIGEGNIDFLRVLSIFKKRGYSGPLVLEYFDPPSLIKAKKELQRLLKLDA